MSSSLAESFNYAEWRSGYQSWRSTQDVVTRKNEERIDYRHASQAYPDYLDYVEEWEWAAEEQSAQLLSAVVYKFASAQRLIQCQCGSVHKITRESTVDENSVDAPGLRSKCWFQTLQNHVSAVLTSLHSGQAHLPNVVESMMSRILTWQLASAGHTPTLLPFEVFKQVWWTSDDDRPKVVRHLLAQLSYSDRHQLSIEREQRQSVPARRRDILLWYPHSDHGMHTLRMAIGVDKFRNVLKWMNNKRRALGSKEIITEEMIINKQRECLSCACTMAPSLQTQGIYYAPPGSGKTTAMNRELFVGFDTDWCGVGLTRDDYGFILRMGIPIITNQMFLFADSGLKIVGMYSDYTRFQPNGKPFATKTRLANQARELGRDGVILYQKSKYLSDHILYMEIFTILQRIIANYAINVLPFYKNERSEEWTKSFPKLIRREALMEPP